MQDGATYFTERISRKGGLIKVFRTFGSGDCALLLKTLTIFLTFCQNYLKQTRRFVRI